MKKITFMHTVCGVDKTFTLECDCSPDNSKTRDHIIRYIHTILAAVSEDLMSVDAAAYVIATHSLHAVSRDDSLPDKYDFTDRTLAVTDINQKVDILEMVIEMLEQIDHSDTPHCSMVEMFRENLRCYKFFQEFDCNVCFLLAPAAEDDEAELLCVRANLEHHDKPRIYDSVIEKYNCGRLHLFSALFGIAAVNECEQFKNLNGTIVNMKFSEWDAQKLFSDFDRLSDDMYVKSDTFRAFADRVKSERERLEDEKYRREFL